MAEEPTRAQQLLGDLAPKLAVLTDKVLFGDVWQRPGLSPRDRSLVTVAALVALYRTDQLSAHLQRALDNGLTEQELVEAITQLAFYAGWPCAVSAVGALRQVTRAERRAGVEGGRAHPPDWGRCALAPSYPASAGGAAGA